MNPHVHQWIKKLLHLLFDQQLMQSNIKQNLKYPHHKLVVIGIQLYSVVSPKKDQ